jgi:hypothetical protein
MPPVARVRPSLLRVRVQNSDLGMGEGLRHCRIVCTDLGDVVVASKVYKISFAVQMSVLGILGRGPFFLRLSCA